MDTVEFDSLAAAAAFETTATAGFLDKDAPHGFGGGCKEIAATVPPAAFGFVRSDESEIRFVHERGGLEGLAGFFVEDSRRSKFAKFLVNEGQKLLNRLRVACVDLRHDLCNVVHVGERPNVAVGRWEAMNIRHPCKMSKEFDFTERVTRCHPQAPNMLGKEPPNSKFSLLPQ